jgi:hypothetical protein
MPASISIFIAYSQEDIKFVKELKKDVKNIPSNGRSSRQIFVWHDREISAGTEWDHTIRHQLEEANVILFLVSRDFLATDYCTEVEVKRAMERHESGSARVIPIIVRSCDWQDFPFGKLQALPEKGRPIADHESSDTAYLNIRQGLRKVFDEIYAVHEETQPELLPPPKRTSTPKTTDPKDKPVLSSKDELMKILVIWVYNVHRYSGTTIDELKPVYEEVITIFPSLTEVEMISYLRDPEVHVQFRDLLKDEFPGFSDKDWAIDWTLKLFLFLKSKEFADRVPLREIPEPIRLRLRSHIENFRG